MFWTEELWISQGMYLNSRLMMHVLRFLGYFPLTIKPSGSKVLLKWSPRHASYSFALGAFLTIGSYWQAFVIFVNNPNLPMSSITILTIFVGYTGWMLTLICGVYVIPTRFLKFFSYVKCLQETDSIMGTTYTKSEKCATLIKFLTALTPGMLAFVADYRMTISFGSTPWRFVKKDGILYPMQVISTAVPYIIRHLVFGLEKRISRLNKLLEMENLNCQKSGNRKASDNNITGLSKTYLKLCDAADILNDFTCETMAVAILAAGIQLLHPAYFLIVYIDGTGPPLFTQAGLMNIFKDLAWLICIIDACYDVTQKIKSTEKLVCRLLSWNVGSKFRLKAKRFALYLGLRKIEFSACGFFDIDRYLFTDMLSTYTTVLMMLLQLNEDEQNKQ